LRTFNPATHGNGWHSGRRDRFQGHRNPRNSFRVHDTPTRARPASNRLDLIGQRKGLDESATAFAAWAL